MSSDRDGTPQLGSRARPTQPLRAAPGCPTLAPMSRRDRSDAPGEAAEPSHPDARVAGWQAPPMGDRRVEVRGALGGSRLFEQPQYRAEAERFAAFVAAPGPVAVEVGFDFGRRLLSLAEADPSVRWVGLEVRKARADDLTARAASRGVTNLLPWRADARTVFRALMPAGRLTRVDVLFPTPWWHAGHRARRMLLSPGFVDDVCRALAPDGVLHVATDVAPYFAHVDNLMAGWRRVDDPPPAPIPSRREHVCARDGIPICRGTWRP